MKYWRLWTSLDIFGIWKLVASSATQLALHLWILPGEGGEANFGVLHCPSMVPMSIYVNFSSISAGDSLGIASRIAAGKCCPPHLSSLRFKGPSAGNHVFSNRNGVFDAFFTAQFPHLNQSNQNFPEGNPLQDASLSCLSRFASMPCSGNPMDSMGPSSFCCGLWDIR